MDQPSASNQPADRRRDDTSASDVVASRGEGMPGPESRAPDRAEALIESLLSGVTPVDESARAGEAASATNREPSDVASSSSDPDEAALASGRASAAAAIAAAESYPPGARSGMSGASTGDKWAHRRAEPRPLALMWSSYLLACTVLCLGAITASPFLTPDVYRPAARLLIGATVLGLVVFWPMIRLSQRSPEVDGRRSAWLDIGALLLPLHAVIWPQALPVLGNWRWTVSCVLAAHATAWLVLIGAVLAIAHESIRRREHEASSERGGGSARLWWMVTFIGLALGAPILQQVWMMSGVPMPGAVDQWLDMLSPVSGVFEITSDRSWTGQFAAAIPVHWHSALAISAAAGAMWSLAWGTTASGGSGGRGYVASGRYHA